MKKIILFACLTAGLLFSQEKINKSFDGIRSVEIVVASSDVLITKSSDSEAHIEVKHSFDEDDAPIIEKRGSRLVIKEESRNRGWSSGSATYKLQIPDDLAVSYSSGSGEFSIDDVKLKKAAFNSGSTDFDIRNVDVQKSLKINSGSSDINMKNVSAEISINTGSGDVDISQLEGSVSFNAGSGDITVTQFKILDDCSFNNGSGKVKLSLSNKPQADISMNSGSGSQTIDFNGNEIDADITMAAKKERNIIAPFKFDKTREISKWNDTYYEKTAVVGNGSISIRMNTGSGRVKIQE